MYNSAFLHPYWLLFEVKVAVKTKPHGPAQKTGKNFLMKGKEEKQD